MMSTSVTEQRPRARTPRRAPYICRMRSGFRPDPRAINAPMKFEIPDRVFRTEGISVFAKVTAAALCLVARGSRQAVGATNKDLIKLTSASGRTIDDALAELEGAGLIYRVSRNTSSVNEDLEKLASIGFNWLAELPARLIVLLWTLPQPEESLDDVSAYGKFTLTP